MARSAILVMVPVVALLAWRDFVVERQLRELAYADAYRDERARVQVAARDEALDDAAWALLLGEPLAAVSHVKRAEALPAPTGMPERGWRIAAAASCAAFGANTRAYAGWRDARVDQYCASSAR